MKPGFTKLLPLIVAFAAASPLVHAADPALTNTVDRLSYSIGVNMGMSLKSGGVEVNPDMIAQAVKDVIAGGELRLNEQEARQTIMAYQQEMRAKREQERMLLAEKNRVESDKFLAENKAKPGVKVLEVRGIDGNPAELQYKTISAGEGDSPRLEDTVVFNYTARTLNGTEVDSTAKRGQPIRTVLTHYPVPGVKEAIQKMKPGAKWEVFLPANLALGNNGAPNVEPGSALVYEIELLSSEAPQPLTSDIIRVPSKEELDRGAKIEVIKSEDLKKMQQTNSAAPKR